MNGKHNCVEKRTDWSISMELDQEKQNQEAAERCRALAQRIVRELAPRSVQVLEDSGLLEKAFCKMNTAVVQSAPELLVVADPQWVTLPAVQAEKVLLVCAEYAGMADCAKQLAAQGFCRELAWKDRGKEQLTALFCRMAAMPAYSAHTSSTFSACTAGRVTHWGSATTSSSGALCTTAVFILQKAFSSSPLSSSTCTLRGASSRTMRCASARQRSAAS
jgi:hypothetical protein